MFKEIHAICLTSNLVILIESMHVRTYQNCFTCICKIHFKRTTTKCYLHLFVVPLTADGATLGMDYDANFGYEEVNS